MVKYFIGQDTLLTDLGDINVESDGEGDIEGPGEETQMAKENNQEPIRAIFILGSFSAYVLSNVPLQKNDGLPSWKSLFFYRCTDEISFAPLKSQGIDSRLKYIRENTVDAAPPPCSPKSIYVLATLVRQPLTNLLTCNIDVSTLVGNHAPTRHCPSSHRKQALRQRRLSSLVGYCCVRTISKCQTRANTFV